MKHSHSIQKVIDLHPPLNSGLGIGQLHLFNLKNHYFPNGLLFDLIRLLKKNNEDIILSKELKFIDFGDAVIDNFIKTIDDILEIDPYNFQLDVFKKSLQLNKSLVLSPTSSRKEFNYLSSH